MPCGRGLRKVRMGKVLFVQDLGQVCPWCHVCDGGCRVFLFRQDIEQACRAYTCALDLCMA